MLLLMATLALAAKVAAQTVDSVITAGLREPHSIAVDSNNIFFLTDSANNRVVRYAPDSGQLVPLAGGGPGQPEGYADGFGVKARFFDPKGLVLARSGIVVADYGNHVLRLVTPRGDVTTFAGRPGVQGTNDGPLATATFNYPIGLALDSTGNIYIADSKNNAIRKLDTANNVTTLVGGVSGGLFEPAGVAIGDNGDIWVADTRNHTIKCFSATGVLYPDRVVGSNSRFVSGSDDSVDGAGVLFNHPRALMWLSGEAGLLVSDTGNHTLRRVYYNTDFSHYTASTFAGRAGDPGLVNGPLAEAKLNSPIGLGRDISTGDFLIVDSANSGLRRIQTAPPQPPVSEPSIGVVTFVPDRFTGEPVSVLSPVTQAVFNDDVIIAILGESGAETLYTFGITPPSILQDKIPSPDKFTGLTPKFRYRNGLSPNEISQADSLISPTLPDMTIKAIGLADGRRPSKVVQARFQFKTANPVVVGNNAASFSLTNQTSGVQMFYTINESDPTNNTALNPASQKWDGKKLAFTLGDSNLVFKVQAYKEGFLPSAIVTNIFSPTNFVSNIITFGFDSSEASSDFVGAAGQRFYAPVTLNLLPAQKIYTLQFNLSVTSANASAPPVVAGTVPSNFLGFHTALMTPIPGTTIFRPIPPSIFVGTNEIYETNFFSINDTNGVPFLTNFITTNFIDVFTNLVVTNTTQALLGVGWAERFGASKLYPSLAQDLVTFSQPHDTMFESAAGRVVLGSFSFVIPRTAGADAKYRIQIGRPSGTDDGVGKPGSSVFIEPPTKGSLGAGQVNAIKEVTVGSRRYIVGDAGPFRWLNAGDFGDTNLLSDDVVQVFQSAVYFLNTPPLRSDLFDAMDSSDGSVDLGLIRMDNPGSIDSITRGDGQLNVDDVFVTLRRALDPTVKWFARFWSGGDLQVVEVPNVFRGKPNGRATKLSTSEGGASATPSTNTAPPFVAFSVGDLVGQPGQSVEVPVYASVTGNHPLRVLMLNLYVRALDDAPLISTPVSFTPVATLGAPAYEASRGPENYAGAWLDETVAGLRGESLIGNLRVTIPAGAKTDAAYRVEFGRVSGSPNGFGLFPQTIAAGVVALRDRSGSSWNDGIPDAWRLRMFGSISNLLSHARADADGDGISNWAEFKAGTDPMDLKSKLELLAKKSGGNGPRGVALRWPSVAGKHYILESAPTLFGSPWTVVATNIPGSGADLEFTDANQDGGARFYRLRLVE
jgi:hypothetical protein